MSGRYEFSVEYTYRHQATGSRMAHVIYWSTLSYEKKMIDLVLPEQLHDIHGIDVHVRGYLYSHLETTSISF